MIIIIDKYHPKRVQTFPISRRSNRVYNDWPSKDMTASC